MDFTIGEVYQVILSTNLYGERLVYPITLTGKCLTTGSEYVTFLDPHNNTVKGFKKTQLAKASSCNVDPVKAVKDVKDVKAVKALKDDKTVKDEKPKIKWGLFGSKKTTTPPPTPPPTPDPRLIPLLELHLKTHTKVLTPFSSEITKLLDDFLAKQEICNDYGIIPLDGGHCISYKGIQNEDEFKALIEQEYKRKTNSIFFLSRTSFLKIKNILLNKNQPVFIVSLHPIIPKKINPSSS